MTHRRPQYYPISALRRDHYGVLSDMNNEAALLTRAIMPRSRAADVALRRVLEAYLQKRPRDGVTWKQGTTELIVAVGEDLVIVDLSEGLDGALRQPADIGATR
jgi:hypothetical protein